MSALTASICLIEGGISVEPNINKVSSKAHAQVNIFQPPAHLQNEWVLASDLTGKLLTYMHSTGWKVLLHSKLLLFLMVPTCMLTRCPFVIVDTQHTN